MFAYSSAFVPPSYHFSRPPITIFGPYWLLLTLPAKSRLSWVVCLHRSPQSPSQTMTTKTIAPATNLRWLTTSEVCERLGVSYHTWSKWRQRGCTPRVSKLPNGELRVREDWLHDFMTDLEVRS